MLHRSGALAVVLVGCMATTPEPTVVILPARSAAAAAPREVMREPAPPAPPQLSIEELCAQKCALLDAPDLNSCAEVCLADYQYAVRKARGISKTATADASASSYTPPPKIAPPPPAPPDAYFFVLADCIHRAREGERHAVCRFSRPIDQMNFGQTHCDERCAALSGTVAPSSSDE